VALIGNNELLILFFNSENFDIYNHSPKYVAQYEVLYKSVQSKTKSDGSSKSSIITNNNPNCSPPPPFTFPFTVAIGVTSYKARLDSHHC
jgi:hypothetical protein